jgi:hypothetical protein
MNLGQQFAWHDSHHHDLFLFMLLFTRLCTPTAAWVNDVDRTLLQNQAIPCPAHMTRLQRFISASPGYSSLRRGHNVHDRLLLVLHVPACLMKVPWWRLPLDTAPALEFSCLLLLPHVFINQHAGSQYFLSTRLSRDSEA